MNAKDPVCGMTVEDRDVKAKSTFEEKTYDVCSTSYKEKFGNDSAACEDKKTYGKEDFFWDSYSAPHEH